MMALVMGLLRSCTRKEKSRLIRFRVGMFLANRRTRSGQAAIMVTLTLPLTLGLVGMVVDMGWAYWREEACRTAAQAAAFASAMAANKASNQTCGSGVSCTTSYTACPSNPTSPPSSVVQNGCLYAKANGFTTGGNNGRQNVLYGANTTNSPVSGVTPAYWVRFVVAEKIPTLFSAVLGQPWMVVSARSTGGAFSSSGGGCIFVLDHPSQNSAGAYTQNSSNMTTGCGLYVDSSATGSVTVNSSNMNFSNGASLVTHGTVTANSSNINFNGGGSEKQNQPAFADPMTGLTPPTPSLPCTPDPHINSANTSVSKGTYCAMTINSSNVTFNSGVYIFTAGSLTINSSNITATSGVTLYFTGSAGNLAFNSGNMSLTAPSGGSTDGIALWKDGTTINTGPTNSSNLSVNGIIYEPYTNFTYNSSNGATQTTIIVNKLVMNSCNISQAATSQFFNGGGSTGGAYLIE